MEKAADQNCIQTLEIHPECLLKDTRGHSEQLLDLLRKLMRGPPCGLRFLMCAVLPAGLLLLCQAQDSGQHTWVHGSRTDAGVALLCKIAQNTSRGHHGQEIAAQFLE